MRIAQISPSTAKRIKNAGLDPEDPRLETALDFSLNNSGAIEPDHTTDNGESCNPRPARIAFILLNDAAATDTDTIAAGMAAAVPIDTNIAPLPESVRRLVAQSRLNPAEIIQLPPGECENAGTIAIAVFLDRLRHAHLARADEQPVLFAHLSELLPGYKKLAACISDHLHALLAASEKRLASGQLFQRNKK